MAEMAIAVPSSSTSLPESPRMRPTTTMMATAVQAITPSTFVSESSSFWSGDRVRVTEVSIVAICPIWVSMAVAVTTIAAVPRVTDVFWNSMLERSPTPTSPPANVACLLGDRRALTGQRRFLRLERGRPDDPAVGGHDVAGLDVHDVPGNHVDGRHLQHLTVPDHLALRHLHLRQRVDAGARRDLLTGAEHHVQHDEDGDEQGGGHLADHEADDGDRHQHDVHRVPELLAARPPRPTAASRS